MQRIFEWPAWRMEHQNRVVRAARASEAIEERGPRRSFVRALDERQDQGGGVVPIPHLGLLLSRPPPNGGAARSISYAIATYGASAGVKMKLDLTGMRALVTGASRGVGYGIAELFAASGAQVVATARSEERLDQLARSVRDAGGAI